jgi:hypothetical protein
MYVGNYSNGIRSGIGQFSIFSDFVSEIFGEQESVYTGEFKNDMRHGKGMLRWANGSCYNGYWRNDRRHNVTGKMSFKEGEVYDGHWEENMMHGYGTMWHNNGMVFKGQFVEGIP